MKDASPLQRAMSAFLMALGAEIPEPEKSRIQRRASAIAAWLEQSGQADAAAMCRDLAASLDVMPSDEITENAR